MEAHAGESGEDKSDVAATVPFLFLHEAEAYLEPVLAVLKEDRPDAIVHDFAGIAGTLAADVLGVPNVMLYTSYPANGEYSVAAGFETVSPDHPLRVAADELADRFVVQYGCRKMTVKEIFDGRGDLNLVMMQKRLVPHNESFDDSFVFTGVQIGKRTAFGSWKAPADGKPLLYSSLGTAFNNWPEYYPILFDAVRDLDIHVFAALGSIDPASFARMYPPMWSWARWCPSWTSCLRRRSLSPMRAWGAPENPFTTACHDRHSPDGRAGRHGGANRKTGSGHRLPRQEQRYLPRLENGHRDYPAE